MSTQLSKIDINDQKIPTPINKDTVVIGGISMYK